jgi:WD40 repeat protein
MATAYSSNSQRPPDESGPIEQLLVMHCLKEDSVLGREGFGVRAASPGAADPQTLEWAHKLEQYELPLDMKTGALLSNQAPRRLALVPGPLGRVALIHTAYLPEDTVGRSHSFVSQVLLVPELETVPAVAAWGASDWQTGEYARGETKVLPTLEHLPRGTLIDDAALTAFLSGGSAPADQSLARTIYPGRVESNLETRKHWVRAALQGFLRAGEPNATRARVCILAEPGVVALLVYAIARLLPPQITGSFPFSTYEPPHTTLRENKVARVIGGYARNGFDRGEYESLGRKSYVADTFRDVHGPDLIVDSSWPLEGLLTLVSNGDWNSVDEIRDLWSRDTRSGHAAAASLADALRVRPLAAALKVGTLGAEGLLELKRNRFGEALFRDDEFRRPAWESLRKVWSRPSIRDAFTDTLREHLDELLDEVKGRVEAGPSGSWRDGWEALKPVVPPERRFEELSKFLVAIEQTATALPAEERASLIGEWSVAAPANAMLPASLHWLARAANADEFKTLVGSPKVSARVVGLAACLALGGSAEWASAPSFLKDLSEDRFHAFVSELPNFELRKPVYERLRSDGALTKVFVDRLIRLRTTLPEKCAEEVLSAVRCDDSAWREYWLKNEGNHFAAVLKNLAPNSQLSRRLWDGMLAQVTAESFADSGASKIGTLVEFGKRFPDSLSREQIAQLDSWSEINLEFASPPKSLPAGKSASLTQACRAVGVTREVLTQSWFRVHVLNAKKSAEMKERAAKFGRSVLGFYETEDAACEQALKLANEVKNGELCRLCKTELFTAIASVENRDRLARKFDYELRETDIRPHSEVELRPSGRRAASGGRGLGVGRLRLPAKATPYAMAFLGGVLFGGVLLLLVPPMFAHVMTNFTGWSNAGDLAAEQKARQALEARMTRANEDLEESRQETKKQKSLVADRESEVDDLNHKLNESAAALKEAQAAAEVAKKQMAVVTPPTPTPGTARATAPNAESIKKQLDELIVDKPLNREDIPEAQRLLAELARLRTPANVSDSDELVKMMLPKLMVRDVPRDISATQSDKQNEYAERTDFAFIKGDKNDRLAIATLNLKPEATHSLTVYFLNLAADRIWENQLGSPKALRAVCMSSSLGGEYVLLGIAANAINPDYRLIKCDQFFIDNVNKARSKPPGWREATLSLNPQIGMKPAFSENGRWCAVAEAETGRSPRLPSVKICSATRGSSWELSLDFEPYRKQLEPDWQIASVSFDRDAKSLVVGFAAKPFLIVCALPDLPPPPSDPKDQSKLPSTPQTLATNLMKLTGTPVGWAHCSDGKHIAIISNGQIFIDDLAAWREKAQTPKVLFDQDTKNATCVAFGPKGAVLATGDSGGVIAVRSISMPSGASGESEGKVVIGNVVMRLKHVGPIQKLAFSPDGRVLAALAPPVESVKAITLPSSSYFNGNGDRPGMIRLWVTENWERVK